MKITLLLACLLVCALSFTFNRNIVTEDDDRVKIDFYYESLCPYCQQYMERSLKVAASTKVLFYIILRISGRSVTLTSSLMVMPKESKMDPPGHSLANMDLPNAKATLLRPAPSKNTISTPRPSPSSSASKPTPTTGTPVAENALKPTTLTGISSASAPPAKKESNILSKWLKRPKL
jgi:hypothetical protein